MGLGIKLSGFGVKWDLNAGIIIGVVMEILIS